LVGFPPQASDPELGYIVVGERRGDGTSAVASFVEKPASAVIRDLIARAALWNSFIFAGCATTLLALLDRAFPGIVAGMQAALVPREPRGLCNPVTANTELAVPAILDLAVQQARWSSRGLPGPRQSV